MSDPNEHNAGWCARLYAERAASLLLYGRALGLSHSEAEDVLHEVFVELLGRAEAPNKPAHYCVRSLRNRTLNYRRSLWRRVRREWESLRWFERTPHTGTQEAAAMRELARLPATQRETIVLKIWHGYTFEQIGELLDISPNTAAGRYRYGLEKLRNHFCDTHYEPDADPGESTAVLAAPATIETT